MRISRNDKAILSMFVLLMLLLLSLKGFFYIPMFGKNDNAVTVAVIDSGCQKRTNRNVVEEISFTNTTYGYAFDSPSTKDIYGHGTIVCNTISSIAPNAKIIAIKIIDSSGLITFPGLMAAVKWAVEEKGAEVVNLSLGSAPYTTPEVAEAFKKYQEMGVYIVSAAGNEGNSQDDGRVTWPALLPWIIAVGAITDSGKDASYGSYGKNVDAGETVLFGELGEYDQNTRGTSFSAPVVSGKIAYLLGELKGRGIDVNYQEVLALLIEGTARFASNAYSEKGGWGSSDISYIVENLENLMNEVRTKIYISAVKEDTIQNRFYNETFTLRWFALDPGSIGSSSLSLSLSENLSGNLSVQRHTWGSLVTAEITNLELSSNIEKSIVLSSNDQELTTKFLTSGEANYRVIVDTSLGVDGYDTEFASLNVLEEFLRRNSVEVTFDYHSNMSLSGFDSVILFAAGEHIVPDSTSEFSNFDPTQVQSYRKYVEQGGNLLYIGGGQTERSLTNSGEFLDQFGVNAKYVVPPSNDDQLPSFNLFTTEEPYSTDIFQGVSSLPFAGITMESNNVNLIEIAWATVTVRGNTSLIPVTTAIAIAGTFGQGKLLVYNSPDSFRSEIFTATSSGHSSDGFLLNAIRWFSS